MVFFSSRLIANELLMTDNKTKYEFIPLHPHNSLLQLWLELGGIGIILFFLIIKLLFDKIYLFSYIDHKVAAAGVFSFFQIFFVGQISYGFWQIWWLTIILLVLMLYNFLFNYIKNSLKKNNASLLFSDRKFINKNSKG